MTATGPAIAERRDSMFMGIASFHARHPLPSRSRCTRDRGLQADSRVDTCAFASHGHINREYPLDHRFTGWSAWTAQGSAGDPSGRCPARIGGGHPSIHARDCGQRRRAPPQFDQGERCEPWQPAWSSSESSRWQRTRCTRSGSSPAHPSARSPARNAGHEQPESPAREPENGPERESRACSNFAVGGGMSCMVPCRATHGRSRSLERHRHVGKPANLVRAGHPHTCGHTASREQRSRRHDRRRGERGRATVRGAL